MKAESLGYSLCRTIFAPSRTVKRVSVFGFTDSLKRKQGVGTVPVSQQYRPSTTVGATILSI